MKVKELMALPENELQKKHDELCVELMKENAHIATGAVPKNPGKVRVVKRNIARIKFLLHKNSQKKGKGVVL